MLTLSTSPWLHEYPVQFRFILLEVSCQKIPKYYMLLYRVGPDLNYLVHILIANMT